MTCLKNYNKKKDVLFTLFECLKIKLYKNINLYKIAMIIIIRYIVD